MNVYATIALLVSVALLQATVAPAASLGGAQPEWALLCVIVWGLLRGPRNGFIWALFLGLMLDQLSPLPVGFYTLPLLAAAWVTTGGRDVAFGTHFVLPMIMTVIGTAVYSLGQLALLSFVRGGYVPWNVTDLSATLLPILALNLLWLPVVYVPLRALARKGAGPRMEWGSR